jgi:hypothetical protein
MDRRLTTIEVQIINLGTKLNDHMTQTNRMIEKLDDKSDRHELMMARLIGGLILAQFLAILFAPVIRSAFGLST